MISPEGERVKFITPVNARSNVENWLLSLQKEMVETLRKSLREGLKNFVNGAQKTRKDWILKHKGQVVTVVSQILWTLDTEDAIKEQPTKGDSLAVWYNHGLKQLQVLTEMVRGELTELSRKILVALITTDVHNRDIVNQLNTNEVESITDNYWQQQLRYYSGDDTEGCIVRQVTASMDYGY
jgi:dynein heavy chain